MQPVIRDGGILTEVQCAFDGSIAVNKYDFLFHDSNDVKPASSQADQGSEAANQAAFAPRFMGLAMDTRLVGDEQAVPHFPVATDVFGEFDCASATFEVGDMVTVDEHSGGTYLENQKLVKTTDPALAIGRVVKRYANATTRVLVRLQSRVLPHGYSQLQLNGATGENNINLTDNLADALSIRISGGNDFMVFDTTNSDEKLTILGAVTQKLGFYGTAPVVQPSGAAQAALTNSTGGTGDGTLSAVGNTMAGDVSAAINNNFTELFTLQNAMRTALVNLGLIKGAA